MYGLSICDLNRKKMYSFLEIIKKFVNGIDRESIAVLEIVNGIDRESIAVLEIWLGLARKSVRPSLATIFFRERTRIFHLTILPIEPIH